MKHKTSELIGPPLDAAVALADGRLVTADEPGGSKGEYRAMRKEFGGGHVGRWYSATTGELWGWEPLGNQGSPSTDWSIGGPIIDRENIAWQRRPGSEVEAAVNGCADIEGGITSLNCHETMTGPTILIAAMRAYVAAKLGDVVELP